MKDNSSGHQPLDADTNAAATARDPLAALAESTLAFYARFDVQQPELEASIRHFQEEVHELIEAAQLGEDQAHIGEEAVDVLVTALGVCFASGLTMAQFVEQIETVIRKNDAKTHETHAIIDGKIRRKPAAL